MWPCVSMCYKEDRWGRDVWVGGDVGEGGRGERDIKGESSFMLLLFVWMVCFNCSTSFLSRVCRLLVAFCFCLGFSSLGNVCFLFVCRFCLLAFCLLVYWEGRKGCWLFCPRLRAGFRIIAPTLLVATWHLGPIGYSQVHSASQSCQRSTGVRSLAGYHPTETQHCCRVYSVVVSKSASD